MPTRVFATYKLTTDLEQLSSSVFATYKFTTDLEQLSSMQNIL